MKGIAHFSVGIALASFFQEAVKAGAEGNPLYFVLGGVFGLLPDTLDFKLYKFLYKHDCEITPDPLDPDPQEVADGLARVFHEALTSGRPVSVKLNTVRLGCDLWRRYRVTFDVPGRRVIVALGPVVQTDQSMVEEGAPVEEGVASLGCGIKLDYEAETNIDILDGPSFMMTPSGDGRIVPLFIPWHREWSHSFVIGLVFALAGTVCWGALAGLVVFGAYAAHILVDQAGFLGSDLLYPFGRSCRAGGWKLVHSSDSFPNFAVVWLSGLAVGWNLYRDLPWPLPLLNPLKVMFYGAVIPLGLMQQARAWRRRVARSVE